MTEAERRAQIARTRRVLRLADALNKLVGQARTVDDAVLTLDALALVLTTRTVALMLACAELGEKVPRLPVDLRGQLPTYGAGGRAAKLILDFDVVPEPVFGMLH